MAVSDSEGHLRKGTSPCYGSLRHGAQQRDQPTPRTQASRSGGAHAATAKAARRRWAAVRSLPCSSTTRCSITSSRPKNNKVQSLRAASSRSSIKSAARRATTSRKHRLRRLLEPLDLQLRQGDDAVSRAAGDDELEPLRLGRRVRAGYVAGLGPHEQLWVVRGVPERNGRGSQLARRRQSGARVASPRRRWSRHRGRFAGGQLRQSEPAVQRRLVRPERQLAALDLRRDRLPRQSPHERIRRSTPARTR